MPDSLMRAIEGVIGLLNEMHPAMGCTSKVCLMRTDFCCARAALVEEYESWVETYGP